MIHIVLTNTRKTTTVPATVNAYTHRTITGTIGSTCR